MVASDGKIIDECSCCGSWYYRKYLSSPCCQSAPVPVIMNDVRRRLFNLIDATPHLDWLLLTKRPENIRRMWPEHSDGPVRTDRRELSGKYRHNVWLGTSVSLQKHADKQVPELLKCRDLSPVLWLSMEPLLGPVTFRWAKWQPLLRKGKTDHLDGLRSLDWIVVGGESGHGARSMDLSWPRAIRQECAGAGVPFFMKQLSQANSRHYKDFASFPNELQVREYPEVK